MLLHTARIVILDYLVNASHKVDILENGNCSLGIEHELRAPLDLHAVGEHLVGLDTHRNFGDGIELMHLDAVAILEHLYRKKRIFIIAHHAPAIDII